MLHTIEPVRETLHGHFSRDLMPVLTIDPGETVRFRTLPGGWNLEPRRSERRDEPPPTFAPRDPVLDDGHALCGPVAIRGAMPGQTLAVRIDAIQVGAWGTTIIGGWQSDVNDRLGVSGEPGRYLLWRLDAETLTGQDQHGHRLPLRPFMGVMGNAPAEPGRHPTPPPRVTGGNIDCKELIAGSTLYLPVAVPGALFSVGDGHALQGDGEVATTAIECPMERVDLTFDLRPDLHLTTPRAHTPSGWLTFGFHEDLNEAMFIALEAMLGLLGELHGLDRHTALGLASLVVDLRITQIVNGVRGVHAVLPHGVLT
jgi:acetamidase/formamidase